MALGKIRKRDGAVVDFDRSKIKRAMEGAFREVNPTADTRSIDIMADHAVRHIEIAFVDAVPDVEKVQDLVERTLMEFGMFDVAKAYILYRAEHAKVRQVATPEETVGREIFYQTVDGERRKLDRGLIRRRLIKAMETLTETAGLNVDAMVAQAESALYDGMTERDLETCLIMAARSFIERDGVYDRLAARLTLSMVYREVLGGDRANYTEYFISNINRAVAEGRVDKELLTFDLDALAAALVPERDTIFDLMGISVLYDRYFLRVAGGEKRLEAPQTFWMRIAMGLSIAEKPADRTKWAITFYEILSTLRYTPSTPTLFHAGTTYPQLSSCYLNMVEDDLSHIFKVYGDNAQLSKYSGGIGTSWSKIRATGSLVKSTNLESQGVVPFLRIANDVNIAINRSGKRRGAACVYLESWHFEIEDFLDLRKNTGDERRRTHDINTANWIPDLFMKRVAANGEWTLFSPDEVPDLNDLYGKAFEASYTEYEHRADAGEIRIWKRIRARDLWRKMISMLFETGHPWITFKDACNVRSPQDHVGVIHNSNLCTEITLNNSKEETAVCNIGSINLANHMKTDNTVDWDLLEDTVVTAVRMLDNTIDPNFYPTEETRRANMRHRPVGLGLMGFQDVLYRLDIDFDSEEAITFADQSMEFISLHAIKTSALLAKEKGAYESFRGSKWDRGIFPVDTLDLLEAERGMPVSVSRSSNEDWTEVRALVKQYGMRNSNLMAVAPTATISNINGCVPTIEPSYKNLYVKSNMSGEFTVVNEYLVEDLKKLGLWSPQMLEAIKAADGSVQGITTIPPKLRSKYKTASETSMQNLMKVAAYRGKWIDQSQSLNIFFQGSSGKALADVYLSAWHLGLKTTYYLRTVSASAIEKSTVDIAAQNKQEQVAIPDQPILRAASVVETV
jgi:ribonucleoside-diphosphate reductase alpha chain